MTGAYKRRLQLSGNSTLIVSLPKVWVERVGLKKLDEVTLIPVDERSMLIQLDMNDSRETSLEVKPDDDPGAVIRELFARYLSGFDKITLRLPSPAPQLAGEVKEKVRRWLIGVEVVEESAMYIEVQCLPMHTSLPLKKAVERMAGISSNMQVDAFSAMFRGDADLASEVVARDDDVDRFYHFIIRQLNLAVTNPLILHSLELASSQDCLGYMLAAKSIERAADHAVSLCKLVGKMRGWKPSPQMRNVTKRVNDVFRNSIAALLASDAKKAHKTINEALALTEEIDELAESMVYLSRLVVGNIKRIAEYAEDIAEAAVNISSRLQNI